MPILKFFNGKGSGSKLLEGLSQIGSLKRHKKVRIDIVNSNVLTVNGRLYIWLVCLKLRNQIVLNC